MSTPQTPAAVAAAVLDAIEARPDAFDMTTWFASDDSRLLPNIEPTCGTTMCIAGWAAHVTGWTLKGSLATRHGQRQYVGVVGRDALGLDNSSDGVFWASKEQALERLREIAGRCAADGEAR